MGAFRPFLILNMRVWRTLISIPYHMALADSIVQTGKVIEILYSPVQNKS